MESVYETDSVFTLKGINEVLEDNKIVKPKPSNKSENELIKILERGVEEGKRDHACFTLAIFYKVQGYSRQYAEDKLIDWGKRCTPTFSAKSVLQKVKSAYENTYRNYKNWLYRLTDEPDNSERAPKKKLKVRKRISISEHTSNLEQYLSDNGGTIHISQSKLSQMLNIPIRSLKNIIKESENISTKPVGKGRNAYTVFELHKTNNKMLQKAL